MSSLSPILNSSTSILDFSSPEMTLAPHTILIEVEKLWPNNFCHLSCKLLHRIEPGRAPSWKTDSHASGSRWSCGCHPCTGALLQMLGPGHPDHLEEKRLRDIIEEINWILRWCWWCQLCAWEQMRSSKDLGAAPPSPLPGDHHKTMAAALCPGSSPGMCGMLLTMMLMRTMALALLRTFYTGPWTISKLSWPAPEFPLTCAECLYAWSPLERRTEQVNTWRDGNCPLRGDVCIDMI